MKSHIKHFLIGMLCLSFNINGHAQEQEKYISHPDTLRMDLPNGQIIELCFKDIQSAIFDATFINKWMGSINKIQAVLKLESYESPIKVKLINKLIENEMKDLVNIRPINTSENVYISRNGELQNIARMNEVFFIIDDIRITIKLSQLEQLNSLKGVNLKALHEELASTKEGVSDKRKAYYVDSNLENGSFTHFKITDSGVNDFLSITGGIGIGLFRDKLVPDFSLNAAINIRDKHGINMHKFGLQSSFHYFFNKTIENSYDMSVNTFLTAFYKRNLSKSTLNDNWMGIGIGYLVKESGGYFQKNTFNVGLFLNANQSSIDIIPEIIITDDFKTVFPSIRLGLTF